MRVVFWSLREEGSVIVLGKGPDDSWDPVLIVLSGVTQGNFTFQSFSRSFAFATCVCVSISSLLLIFA